MSVFISCPNNAQKRSSGIVQMDSKQQDLSLCCAGRS